MAYISNNNIILHYKTAGDRKNRAIILIFGLSMTCDDWFELGYVEQLAKYFHVVCIEPRGHGQSTCPHDIAAYSLNAMASDVEAVIYELQLLQPILWGYSLGAKIALATALQKPAAYSGLILGGFELHSKVDPVNDLVVETLLSGPAAWLALWNQMFTVPEGMANRLSNVDASALLAIRQAEGHWPSLEPFLNRISVPVLLYAGENCFFRQATAAAEKKFQQARYIERKGHNHFELMTEATWIVNEVIKDYSQK